MTLSDERRVCNACGAAVDYAHFIATDLRHAPFMYAAVVETATGRRHWPRCPGKWVGE